MISRTSSGAPLLYSLAVLWGVAAIVAPAIVLDLRDHTHPFFPAARNGLEHYSWLSALFQVLGGLTLGLLNPDRPWRWGLVMGAALPLLAVVLAMTNPGGLNIVWPLALVVYALLTLPCVGGSLLGGYLRRILR